MPRAWPSGSPPGVSEGDEMTRDHIDQLIKDAGFPEGIGTLSIDTIRQLTMLSSEAGTAILSEWLAAAKTAGISGNPGQFDHDAGTVIVLKLMGHNVNFGAFFAPAPDNRTSPNLSDPVAVLARAKAKGIGWDGTDLCSASDLAARLELAETRKGQTYYAKVDPDFVVYATIAGIPAEAIHWTSLPFGEWLAAQIRTAQEV